MEKVENLNTDWFACDNQLSPTERNACLLEIFTAKRQKEIHQEAQELLKCQTELEDLRNRVKKIEDSLDRHLNLFILWGDTISLINNPELYCDPNFRERQLRHVQQYVDLVSD